MVWVLHSPGVWLLSGRWLGAGQHSIKTCAYGYRWIFKKFLLYFSYHLPLFYPPSHCNDHTMSPFSFLLNPSTPYNPPSNSCPPALHLWACLCFVYSLCSLDSTYEWNHWISLNVWDGLMKILANLYFSTYEENLNLQIHYECIQNIYHTHGTYFNLRH